MPRINNNIWDELKELIKNSQSILLSTHINADGDGLGSEIAFYYYLKSLNKDCRIINPTPLPCNYKVIDPDLLVKMYTADMDKWLEEVDLTIIFDINPKIALKRINDNNSLDRMELAGVEFLTNVRDGYLEIAKMNSERCILINCDNKDKFTIHDEILNKINFIKDGGFVCQ